MEVDVKMHRFKNKSKVMKSEMINTNENNIEIQVYFITKQQR